METFIRQPEGLTLWAETFGSPSHPAVLLVMGAMGQGIFWPDRFCEQLAQSGHFVIRYDHRDTGRSSTVSALQPYTLNALTSDAVAVLDGLNVAKATVVGLSMGGFIGQLMATQHPQRVERLVLMSTTADHRPYVAAAMGISTTKLLRLPPPTPAFLNYLKKARRHRPKSAGDTFASACEALAATYAGPRACPTAEVEAAVRLSLSRTDNLMAALKHGLAVSVSKNRLKLVQDIRVPTLVIHGRFDPLFPLGHGQYLAENIPGAQLRVLNMGHSFMWSWDDEVRAAVLGFIGSAP
jgi:pimeloyl-ACP methyl ester carboxylesterase